MKPFRQTSLCQIPKPLPLAHPRSADQKLPMPPWHRPHRREAGIPPPRERPLAARCTRRRPDWQGNSTGCRRRCAHQHRSAHLLHAPQQIISAEHHNQRDQCKLEFGHSRNCDQDCQYTQCILHSVFQFSTQNSSAIPCSVPMIWSDACAWVPVYLYATL